MSNSLQPRGLQHTRFLCPPLSPGVCSNSCPLSWWCHPTTLSSVIPLSSCLQSFLDALRIRWPNYWSFGISPSNEYSGLISFRIDGFDLLAVQRTLKSLFQHHSSKASILWRSAFFMVQLSGPYMTSGKTIALTRWTFVGKVISLLSLLFNMLSRLAMTFLPRSKCLNFVAAVTICSDLEPKKIKSVTLSIVSPSTCHEVMGPDTMVLLFWMLSFSQLFPLPSFTFIKRLFSSSLLSAIRVVSPAYLKLLIFLQQSWFQLVLHPAQQFTSYTLHIS